jgi:hypothetical protein
MDLAKNIAETRRSTPTLFLYASDKHTGRTAPDKYIGH